MKLLQDRFLRRLVVRLLLWLPTVFLAWYLLAEYIIVPVGWFTSWILAVIAPGKLEMVSTSGRLLALESNLRLQAPDGQMGYLLLEINPLVYCWSLPLLLSLTLAVSHREKVFRRILGAYLGLLPFQAWGVAFDFLRRTTLHYGPGISAQMGFSPLGHEIIVYGYQFGSLMLPVISASSLWILMHRRFIAEAGT